MGVAVEGGGLDRYGFRGVAGDVARVDLEAAEHPGVSEADDGPLVPGFAAPAGHPPVGPSAPVGGATGLGYGSVVPDQPLLGRKPLVGHLQHPSADAGTGEVDEQVGHSPMSSFQSAGFVAMKSVMSSMHSGSSTTSTSTPRDRT